LYFALVWKDLEKLEVEIPEMDLYILRDSNVGSMLGSMPEMIQQAG